MVGRDLARRGANARTAPLRASLRSFRLCAGDESEPRPRTPLAAAGGRRRLRPAGAEAAALAGAWLLWVWSQWRVGRVR